MTEPARLLEAAAEGLFDRELLPERRDADRYLELAASGEPVVRFTADGIERILINSPEGAERVLETHRSNYVSPDHPYRDLVDQLAATGALMLHRPTADPADAARRTHEELVSVAVSTGRSLAAASADAPVDLELEAQKLFVRLVVRLLFEVDLGELAEPFVRAVGYLEECWGKRRFVAQDAGPWLTEDEERLYRSGLELKDLVAAHIVREAGLERAPESTEAQFLEAVADTVINGYVAQADTLCWALYSLGRHPDVRAAVQEEVDGQLAGDLEGKPQAFQGLRTTRNVIHETLRLYPSAWVLGRRAVADDRISGVAVPAEARVVVSPLAMHRLPAVWEEPERFDPGRFDPERARERPRYAYLPFGRGPRRCPAGPMAMGYLQRVLAVLLHRFEISVDTDRPVRLRGLVALHPYPRVDARFSNRPASAA
jgi:cytochrome P450